MSSSEEDKDKIMDLPQLSFKLNKQNSNDAAYQELLIKKQDKQLLEQQEQQNTQSSFSNSTVNNLETCKSNYIYLPQSTKNLTENQQNNIKNEIKNQKKSQNIQILDNKIQQKQKTRKSSKNIQIQTESQKLQKRKKSSNEIQQNSKNNTNKLGANLNIKKTVSLQQPSNIQISKKLLNLVEQGKKIADQGLDTQQIENKKSGVSQKFMKSASLSFLSISQIELQKQDSQPLEILECDYVENENKPKLLVDSILGFIPPNIRIKRMFQIRDDYENLMHKYNQFLTFKELGKGAFGMVVEHCDLITRNRYAKKTIKNKEEFEQEKQTMQKLLNLFGKEELQKFVALLVKDDPEEHSLFYERGICNLNEFCTSRNKLHLYWFSRQSELFYIAVTMYQYIINLYQKNCFHSDIKLINIIVSKQQFLHELQIKLIDMGCAQFEYNFLTGYTPFYFPPDKFQFADKEERLQAELYQLGRLLQEMMYFSIEKYEQPYFTNSDMRKKLQKRTKQMLVNNPVSIKQCLKVLNQFYKPEFCVLIKQLLTFEKLDLIQAQIDLISKEASPFILDTKRLGEDIDMQKQKESSDQNQKANEQVFNSLLLEAQFKEDPNNIQSQNTLELNKKWSHIYSQQKTLFINQILKQLKFYYQFQYYNRGLIKIKQLPQNLDQTAHPQIFCYNVRFLKEMGKEQELLILLETQFDSKIQQKFKEENMEDYYYILLEKVFRMDINQEKDKIQKLYSEMIQANLKIKNNVFRAKVYAYRGFQFKLLDYLLKAEDILVCLLINHCNTITYKELKSAKKELAETQSLLAKYYMENKNYEKAEFYFQKEKQIREEYQLNSNNRKYANILYYLAQIQGYQGNLKRKLEILYEYQKIYSEISVEVDERYIEGLGNIGETLYQLQEYQLQAKYLQEYLILMKKYQFEKQNIDTESEQNYQLRCNYMVSWYKKLINQTNSCKNEDQIMHYVAQHIKNVWIDISDAFKISKQYDLAKIYLLISQDLLNILQNQSLSYINQQKILIVQELKKGYQHLVAKNYQESLKNYEFVLENIMQTYQNDEQSCSKQEILFLIRKVSYIYQKLDNFQGALTVIQEHKDIDEKYAIILKGIVFFNQKLYEKAISMFKKNVESSHICQVYIDLIDFNMLNQNKQQAKLLKHQFSDIKEDEEETDDLNMYTPFQKYKNQTFKAFLQVDKEVCKNYKIYSAQDLDSYEENNNNYNNSQNNLDVQNDSNNLKRLELFNIKKEKSMNNSQKSNQKYTNQINEQISQQKSLDNIKVDNDIQNYEQQSQKSTQNNNNEEEEEKDNNNLYDKDSRQIFQQANKNYEMQQQKEEELFIQQKGQIDIKIKKCSFESPVNDSKKLKIDKKNEKYLTIEDLNNSLEEQFQISLQKKLSDQQFVNSPRSSNYMRSTVTFKHLPKLGDDINNYNHDKITSNNQLN